MLSGEIALKNNHYYYMINYTKNILQSKKFNVSISDSQHALCL